MIYGYARVSTRQQGKDGNSLEAQVEELKAAGCTEFVTEQYTGTKTDRPKLNELLAKLEAGDTLKVTKLDRLARTATEGANLVKRVLAQGISVHVLNMGLIENTPTGKLIMQIMLAFAEFERDMIVERTQEGKAIARTKEGFREGRPEKFSKEQIQTAMDLLAQGNSYTQVSKMTGISKATLVRKARARRQTA